MESNARIYSLNNLAYGRAVNSYSAIVFTLGNSDHNLVYMLTLLKFLGYNDNRGIYVHLHDPVIFHLLRQTCTATNRDFLGTIEKTYGKLSATERHDVEHGNYMGLVERGICGAAALLGQLPLSGIILNSDTGFKIVQADFKSSVVARRDVPLSRLFHPVFPVPVEEATTASRLVVAERPSRLRIGTFGIPSSSKRTDLVVAAFKLLRREIKEAELIIAGFGAAEYALHLNEDNLAGVVIADSPTDVELQRLMRVCHLGVQLRGINTGESSGVVPQLLANGVPVLVSRVGAFVEYGDAVGYVPSDAAPEDLAALMMEELRFQGHRDAAATAFVRAHSPERFCTQLATLVPLQPDRPAVPTLRTAEMAQ